MINYIPASENVLAHELGEQGRKVLLQSASAADGLQVYVNYALGTESNAVVYGKERWRQVRLRELKKRFDPKGVFNAYNPLVLA